MPLEAEGDTRERKATDVEGDTTRRWSMEVDMVMSIIVRAGNRLCSDVNA